MYQFMLETLLGLKLGSDHLSISPCVPDDWASFTIHYRYRETLYHITLRRVDDTSSPMIKVTLDGSLLSSNSVDYMQLNVKNRTKGIIPLTDDHREHYVEVEYCNKYK